MPITKEQDQDRWDKNQKDKKSGPVQFSRSHKSDDEKKKHRKIVEASRRRNRE